MGVTEKNKEKRKSIKLEKTVKTNWKRETEKHREKNDDTKKVIENELEDRETEKIKRKEKEWNLRRN